MTENLNQLIASMDAQTVAAMMTGKILLDQELAAMDATSGMEVMGVQNETDFSMGFVLGVVRALKLVREELASSQI